MGKSSSHNIAFIVLFLNYLELVLCLYAGLLQVQVGEGGKAEVVSTRACKKLITDIIYEARLQAIVNYNTTVEGWRVSKVEVRGMTLN
jgi:hypothetical protein